MSIKVSVITPTYNSEKYIVETIRSVQGQTYSDWEMIIVDDCSTDQTCFLVEEMAEKDTRIRLIRQTENLGAGAARTVGMRAAKGRFIAYLDSDDIWLPQKLEYQTAFMLEKKCGFSCTSYEVIDSDGVPLKKNIHMLPKVDYVGFLTNNLLQTVGIMVDTEIVDKELLVMPDIRRRQDAVTWLQILKAGHPGYGLDIILAQYRRTKKSLSSNKIKSVVGTWKLYYCIEKLPFLFSCYCFMRYAFLAVWKRLYLQKENK